MADGAVTAEATAEASPAAPVPPPAGRPAAVVAIANQKGGVGKTTTTVNLAACLAELGERVLVVDLDPQTNATSGLGLTPEPGVSLYRPLLGDGNAGDHIRSTIMPGLDMIPSELDLAGSEVDIARADSYLHCFKRALAPVRDSGGYSWILVDCPPSLGILTMNALTGADSIIVPMQCEYYALEGLSVIYRLVNQLRQSGANPVLDIEGILMTMYDGRTNLAAQVVGEVRKHFGERLYETMIPRNVRLSEAPSFGWPIIRYDDHSVGARAYRLLALEFLARRGLERQNPKLERGGGKIPVFTIRRTSPAL